MFVIANFGKAASKDDGVPNDEGIVLVAAADLVPTRGRRFFGMRFPQTIFMTSYGNDLGNLRAESAEKRDSLDATRFCKRRGLHSFGLDRASAAVTDLDNTLDNVGWRGVIAAGQQHVERLVWRVWDANTEDLRSTGTQAVVSFHVHEHGNSGNAPKPATAYACRTKRLLETASYVDF